MKICHLLSETGVGHSGYKKELESINFRFSLHKHLEDSIQTIKVLFTASMFESPIFTGLKHMPHQGSPRSTNPTKMPGLPWSYTPSIQSDWPWPRSPEERKTAHQEQHNGKPVRRHAKGMGRSLTALWQNDAVSQQHVWITYLKK